MTRDVACGLIALAAAAVYLYAATGLPDSALGDAVGADGFPKIIGWALAGTALLLIAQGVAGRVRAQPADPEADTAAADIWLDPRRALLRAAGIVAIAAAYLFLLEILGYIVSIAGVIAAIAVYQGIRPSWRLALVALAGAAIFWVLFAILLDIPMPAGFWARLFQA